MRRARNAGFSLLEVLGAIAILGIWFAIIAEIAMVGLRNEGRSQRALLASLVADDLLSDIEIDMLRGKWPEIASEESQRDDYIIRIEVEPYDLDLPAAAGAQPGSGAQSSGGKAFEYLSG